MNIIGKIILVLIVALLVSLGFYYIVFKTPASPGHLAPQPEAAGQGSPTGGSQAGENALQVQPGGAYTRLLGESDADDAVYAPEDADTAYLSGELPQIAAVGQTYSDNTLPSSDNFCKGLANAKAGFINSINARSKVVADARTKLSDDVEKARKARDDSENVEHAKIDAWRDAYIAKLGAMSKNASLKYKVDTYTKAVSDAIYARREAIKSAISLFRQGLGQVFVSKNKLVDNATLVYKIAVESAFDSAISSCNSGVIISGIRTTLESALKSAHDKFINDKLAAEKMAISIKPLIANRKDAFMNAISIFKAAMYSARKTFKTEFPQGE